MPTKDDHLAKAEHNGTVIEYLLTSSAPCADWIATVAFYKALHFVDALLDAQYKYHPSDHESREQMILKNPKYARIWKHYQPLKNISIIARYLSDRSGRAFRTFDDYLSLDDVKGKVLNHLLTQIQAGAETFLKGR